MPGYHRSMMKTPDLTPAARSALISAGSNRLGATPTHRMTPATRQELEAASLLGPGGGLTIAGTIVRERLIEDQLTF